MRAGPSIARALLAAPVAGAAAAISLALACSGSHNPPADLCGGTGSTDGGPPQPTLSALSIAPLSLVPAFSPCIHDYYVRCGSGANALSVSASGSGDATVSFSRPAGAPAGAQQSVSAKVSVNENDAIVAVASAGGASAEYWVRCLPADFQEMQMTANPDAGTPPPGYYVLGNQILGLGPGYAMILDRNGVPVWYLRQTAGGVVLDVDSVIPGNISFEPDPPDPQAIEIHQLSAWKTTYFNPPSLSRHELVHLSNGHFLVLASVNKSGVDLTGLKITLPDGGTETLGPNGTIGDQTIVELDENGNAVWTWYGSDHLDPGKESLSPVPYPLPDGGVVVDAFHANSIDLDPNHKDNLLVSMRNLSAVIYIERPSGKVIWKMGGTTYTKEAKTYVPVTDPFAQQHDARFQPGWSDCFGGKGQISMFDDETGESNPARGVVYDVVVGAAGGATAGCGAAPTAGATVAWQYKGQTNSSATGSFRISADGSRVIDWGNTDTTNLVFTEVNEAGQDLLDFYFLNGNSSFRTIKFPLSAFDLETLRNTAGKTYQ